MPLRLIFMGTPDFAVPTLAAIVGQGHEVVAAYTQPPRPAGRGMTERPSPVHLAAERWSIPVRHPRSLKAAEEQAAFAALKADAAVVIAYGLILPQPVLDATRLGPFNVHASLLPRWRGAAPIQRAIMAGDTETGVMVMRMEAGLDTGPIMLTERTAIGADETAGELHDRLSSLGADLMVRALAALERGSLQPTPQPEDGASYAAKITKAEARIDWSRPAIEVRDHIRGLSPFPGAWFELASEKGPVRVKVLLATSERGTGEPGTALDDNLLIACGEGALRLLRLQREGKGAMKAEDFLRGTAVPSGTVLG